MSTAVTEPVDSGQTKTIKPLWGGIDIPIIGITGPKASGKTLFASTIAPEETLMIDCEMSSATYSNIPFKLRIDLFEEIKKRKVEPTPLNAWNIVKEIVEKTDGIRVVVIDPWDFVQAGYVDSIEKQPEKFGRTKIQYEKATGLLWADVKSSLHMWLGMQARRINGSIVLINHLGKVWKDGKPTEKDKVKGVDTIYQLASLYLVLSRGPDAKGKIPAAPVGSISEANGGKSRLVHTSINPETGEVELKPILPPRIEPCTPTSIRKYIAAPPDYEKLKKGENIEVQQLSDDEKLLIQREIAQSQLEVEQTRLTALERLQQQTEQQAALRLKQAAAAAATQKPESVAKTTPAVTATASTATATTATFPDSPNPEPCPFVTGPDADENSASAKSEGPSVWDIITAQKQQLGITEAQWLSILAKRNCKETKELTAEQAEQIRIALWEKLTKAEMAKATVSSKSSAS